MATNYFSTVQDAKLFIEITKSASSDYSKFAFWEYTYLVSGETTVSAFIESNMAKAKSILDYDILSSILTAEDIFGWLWERNKKRESAFLQILF